MSLLQCIPPETQVTKEEVTISYSDKILHDYVIRYSNYIKSLGEMFLTTTLNAYSNNITTLTGLFSSQNYMTAYANNVKSLNGVFLLKPSPVYTV